MMIIPALFHRDCFYQHALLLRAFTMLTMLSSPTCFFIPDMFQERLAFIRECNAFNGNSAIIQSFNDGFQIIEPFILSSGCHTDAAARRVLAFFTNNYRIK